MNQPIKSGSEALPTETKNERAYFEQINRKARILQSMISVVYDQVTEREDTHPDFLSHNMIDAALELSRDLTLMTLEDPAYWERRP